MISVNHSPCCLAEDTCSLNGRYENQYEDSLMLCNKKHLTMTGSRLILTPARTWAQDHREKREGG